MKEVKTITEKVIDVPIGKSSWFHAKIRDGLLVEANIKFVSFQTEWEVGYVTESEGMVNNIRLYPQEFKHFLQVIDGVIAEYNSSKR